MSDEAGRQAPRRAGREPALLLARFLAPLSQRAQVARWAIPLAIIVLAFSYPWWGLEGPLSFIFNDGLGIDNDTLFNMSVYVMLALGLNVVVGYAGLLDLGYVAFFALGAYTLGWFGSGLFSTRDIHFLDTNAARLPGIHLTFWVVVLLAGRRLRVRGRAHRLADACACAATTSRSSRSASARSSRTSSATATTSPGTT